MCTLIGSRQLLTCIGIISEQRGLLDLEVAIPVVNHRTIDACSSNNNDRWTKFLRSFSVQADFCVCAQFHTHKTNSH